MDFLSSLALEVVSKIGELLVKPIMEQWEHFVHPNNSINNLKKEHEQLVDMKQALKGKADIDKRKGLKIAPMVEKLLLEVEGFETELQQFYKDEVNEIENNQQSQRWHHYSLSKRATKKRATVINLRDNCEKFQIMSYPLSPPRAREIFMAKIKGFQSRQKIKMEVIENLKNDEFKRISICGMGGVGKTTMVKKVKKIVEANKLFDKVAFTVASQM